jgi:hypothetical protein
LLRSSSTRSYVSNVGFGDQKLIDLMLSLLIYFSIFRGFGGLLRRLSAMTHWVRVTLVIFALGATIVPLIGTFIVGVSTSIPS